MREGWEIKQLETVCKFQNGFAFKSNTFKADGTAVVRITNIQNGVIDLKKVVYIDRNDYNRNLTKYEIVRGDLLIAMSGATTGKIGIHKSDEVLLLNQRVGKFEPLKNLEKSYLFYFLSTKVEESLAISAGSAQPNLSTEQIKSFQVPIPPIQEQKQIVAILDKAFTAIDQAKANIEKNIVNAKELFQSKLNAIFSQKGAGWEEKTLGEVCEKTTNIKWQDYPSKEFEYVDLSAVSRESLTITGTTLVNKENAPSRARKIINTGDVIFATTRPTLRRATIIDEELSGNLCSTGFVVLRPNDNITTDWIFFYLLTTIFMNRMESLQRGASYPAVSDNDVKGSKLSIPMSKLEEKKNIETMNILQENINDLVFQFQQKLKDLEELKKSILQKAFSGELTQKEVVV